MCTPQAPGGPRKRPSGGAGGPCSPSSTPVWPQHASWTRRRDRANGRGREPIKETGDIFYAQADRKWIQDGVAVRVSMVGFDDGSETRRLLNERPDDDPAGALHRARPGEGINANLPYRTEG